MEPSVAARLATSRLRTLVPGIAAVRVTARIETASIGLTKVGGTQASPGQHWHLGSCTKAVTAALVPRLGLDPAMPAAGALGVVPHPDHARTTLADLATHGAGLARDPDPGTMRALQGSAIDGAEQRRLLASRALAAPRGSASYSNLGYVTLGAAIETLTGERWERLVERHVATPLALGSWGVGAPSDGIRGHEGEPGRWRVAPPGADNPPAYDPAGRMHLAMEGWGRFLAAMLGFGPWGTRTLSWLHADAGTGFSPGWRVERPGLLAHTGSNTLWFAAAVLDVARGRAAGVVANAAHPSVSEAVGELAHRLASASSGDAASG